MITPLIRSCLVTILGLCCSSSAHAQQATCVGVDQTSGANVDVSLQLSTTLATLEIRSSISTQVFKLLVETTTRVGEKTDYSGSALPLGGDFDRFVLRLLNSPGSGSTLTYLKGASPVKTTYLSCSALIASK